MICIHVYIYIYTYMCVYIYIYIYIHVLMDQGQKGRCPPPGARRARRARRAATITRMYTDKITLGRWVAGPRRPRSPSTAPRMRHYYYYYYY